MKNDTYDSTYIPIGIQSNKILYNMESYTNSHISLQIRGNQWDWTYTFLLFVITLDCYTVYDKLADITYSNTDNKLYLSTDNKWDLPILLLIKIWVYCEDVINSWNIPHFDIKIDTNPGRINSQIFTLLNKGFYYGSCVKNCGNQDYNMAIEGIDRSLKEFLLYMISQKGIKIELFNSILYTLIVENL